MLLAQSKTPVPATESPWCKKCMPSGSPSGDCAIGKEIAKVPVTLFMGVSHIKRVKRSNNSSYGWLGHKYPIWEVPCDSGGAKMTSKR